MQVHLDDCPDCQQVRTLLHDRNWLVLWLPMEHSRNKLLARLATAGIAPVAAETADCHAFLLDRAQAAAFADAASAVLTAEELGAGRVACVDADRDATLGDYLSAVTVGQFAGAVRGHWLLELIRQDRLTSFFQPIVRADGGRFAYEALLRGREADGGIVGGGQLMKVADEAGLLHTVDLLARRTALTSAAGAGIGDATLFVNFDPSSIYDPSYCLRSTGALVEELGLTPRNVVFEVTESHEARDEAHLKGILDVYRAAGFRVALDDIGSGFSGLRLLSRLKPDFIKIDMDLVRGVHADPFRQSIAGHLVGMAHDNGILVVAEGVECGEERDWLAAAGVDFMQGYLFGRPEARLRQPAPCPGTA
ncbi:MAG TPA: EAL domain-containing protein [Azospirillaceae bacterium]|nr:EAL domain-containing protein [Azospirillaceae bacterium]